MKLENSFSIAMNVFGATTDSERNKSIARIEESNELLKTNLTKINNVIDRHQDSIKTLFEKEVFTQEQINNIKTLYFDPLDQRLSESQNQIKSINNIISKLLDRINSIEVYFKDKP
jgi:chromosome segregation ATPase